MEFKGQCFCKKWVEVWGSPCPVCDPSHHRRRAWPESADWSESPERMLHCSGRWGYWSPAEKETVERERESNGWRGLEVSKIRQERRRASEQKVTSMISVWACLVQKAWGGVVQLMATKLVGLRSRDGVTSSLQAATYKTQEEITNCRI